MTASATRVLSLAVALLAIMTFSASAQVREWVDEEGVVHLEAEGEPGQERPIYKPPRGPLIIEPKIAEPRPSEPRAPSPRLKTRSPSRKPRTVLAFGKTTDYIEGQWRYVQGTIKNPSYGMAKWVKVKVQFFDRRGSLLKIEETYADPYMIPGGREATFTIMTRADPAIARYKTTVLWDQ